VKSTFLVVLVMMAINLARVFNVQEATEGQQYSVAGVVADLIEPDNWQQQILGLVAAVVVLGPI
jgi:hypothetical protein